MPKRRIDALDCETLAELLAYANRDGCMGCPLIRRCREEYELASLSCPEAIAHWLLEEVDE